MRQALLEEFVDLTTRRLATVLADGTAHGSDEPQLGVDGVEVDAQLVESRHPLLQLGAVGTAEADMVKTHPKLAESLIAGRTLVLVDTEYRAAGTLPLPGASNPAWRTSNARRSALKVMTTTTPTVAAVLDWVRATLSRHTRSLLLTGDG
jgi:hypothetical protein